MEDSQKMFLQHIMTCGILHGKDVKDYHKMACERCKEPYSAGDLSGFVLTINSNIKEFGLEIKRAIDELTGKHSFVLVNKCESHITRMLSMYSVSEMELFKKLMEAVVESNSGLVSSTAALRLGDALEPKVTRSDAEEFFGRLVRDKWLVQTTDGQYTLSTRSIADLDQYMSEELETVNCSLCQKLCLVGQRCPKCDVRVHFHCATLYFKKDGGQAAATDESPRLCLGPACRTPWTQQLLMPTVEGVSPSQGIGVGASQGRRKSRR